MPSASSPSLLLSFRSGFASIPTDAVRPAPTSDASRAEGLAVRPHPGFRRAASGARVSGRRSVSIGDGGLSRLPIRHRARLQFGP